MLPSDSSLMEEIVQFDAVLSDISFNNTDDVDIIHGPFPNDTSLMNLTGTESNQQSVFKKPLVRQKKQKLRASLFDSIFKDSDLDTPENVHQPLKRKIKPSSNKESFEIDFSNDSFNTSNENVAPNLITRRKTRQIKSPKKIFFDGVFESSSSDTSFLSRPLLQRHKKSGVKNNPEFSKVFDESSENSLENDLQDNPKNVDKKYQAVCKDSVNTSMKNHQPILSKRLGSNKSRKLIEFDDVFDETLEDSKIDSASSQCLPLQHKTERKKVDSEFFDSILNSSDSYQHSSVHHSTTKDFEVATANESIENEHFGMESNNTTLIAEENSIDNISKGQSIDVSHPLDEHLEKDSEKEKPVVETNILEYSLSLEEHLGEDCEIEKLAIGRDILFTLTPVDADEDENVESLVRSTVISEIPLQVCTKSCLDREIKSPIKLSCNNSLNKSIGDQDEYQKQNISEFNPSFDKDDLHEQENRSFGNSINNDFNTPLEEPAVGRDNYSQEPFSNEIDNSIEEKHSLQEVEMPTKLVEEKECENSTSKTFNVLQEHSFVNVTNPQSFDKNEDAPKSICKDQTLSKFKKRVSFKIVDEEKKRKRSSVFNNSTFKDRSNISNVQVEKSMLSLDSLVIESPSLEVTSNSMCLELCASKGKLSSYENTESSDFQNNSLCSSKMVNTINESNRNSLVNEKLLVQESLTFDKETGEDEEVAEEENEEIENKAEDDDDEEEEENDEEEGEDTEIVNEEEEDEETEIENEEEENEETEIENEEEENEETEIGYEEEENKGTEMGNEEEENEENETGANEVYQETEKEFQEGEEVVNKVNNVYQATESFDGSRSSRRNKSCIEKPSTKSSFNKTCRRQKVSKDPNNVSIPVFKNQLKKSRTVFGEPLCTPLSKRKLKEILDKIPLSELKKKKEKASSPDLTQEQMEQNKIEEALKKRQQQQLPLLPKKGSNKLTKPHKYISTKIYDLIIEKFTPRYGLKSRVKAEEVVIYMGEQVKCIMKAPEDEVVETVTSFKLDLARLGIIQTHWEFWLFINKWFDGYFRDRIFPASGRFVSPYLPDNSFDNIL